MKKSVFYALFLHFLLPLLCSHSSLLPLSTSLLFTILFKLLCSNLCRPYTAFILRLLHVSSIFHSYLYWSYLIISYQFISYPIRSCLLSCPLLSTRILLCPGYFPVDPSLGEFILTADKMKLPDICKTIYSVNGKIGNKNQYKRDKWHASTFFLCTIHYYLHLQHPTQDTIVYFVILKL